MLRKLGLWWMGQWENRNWSQRCERTRTWVREIRDVSRRNGLEEGRTDDLGMN